MRSPLRTRLLLNALALLSLQPAAAATAPPLEGTLLLWASANGCSGYSAYSFAAHRPLGPLVQVNNGLTPLDCIIGLTTNGKGAFAALGYGMGDVPGTDNFPPSDFENSDLATLKGVQVAGKLMFFPYGNRPAAALPVLLDAGGHALLRSNLALSGDGDRIAFESFRQIVYTPSSPLYRLSPELQLDGVLVRNRAGDLLATFKGESLPGWLPGGQLLTQCAVKQTDPTPLAQMCIHDLKAGSTRRLPVLPRAAYTRGGDTFYSFKDLTPSPDSKRVAVTVLAGFDGESGGNDFYRYELPQLWILSLNGQPPQKALNLPPEFANLAVESPVWSPDGKTLAVTLAGYLAFVDVASHKLVGSTEKVYGSRVFTRPIWIR